MLNPCHLTLMFLLLLLTGDNTSDRMKWLHVVYTGFLFCPFAALVLPHL